MIEIQRVIVHKVDHKEYDAPLLSDLESPLSDEVKGCSESICFAMNRNAVHLSIIYTATISSYDGKKFECAYSNSERTAPLRLGNKTIDTNLIEILPRLILWPSSGRGTDHLSIFQNVVARDLDETNPDENYTRFVSRLDQILRDTRWHHRVFINGRVSSHFDELQKVSDYASQTSRQVSEAIDTVTKSFADTLLATIGVILASFLAAFMGHIG